MTAKNRNKLVGSSLVLLFIGVLVLLLNAQATYNWRFQSAAGGVSATGNSVWYHVNAAPTSFPKLAWTLTGSLASCTVQIDFSNDGSTVAGQAVAAQTCTTSGSFIAGSASVYNYIRASYVIGSGGGSISYIGTGCLNGTCTSGGGSGTPGGANTNVQYNNTGSFAGNAGLTYDASHTLGVGGVGLGSGVVSLGGNTSGVSTVTGPAVGGTNTNPDLFSNVIQVPPGTAASPAYATSGCTNCGLYTQSNFLEVTAPGGLQEIVNGNVILGLGTTGLNWTTSQHLLMSVTAPTIAGAGCGGSSASISNNNGTSAFVINVGTAPTSGGCTVTLPAATAGWACFVTDITTNSTSVSLQKQISTTTTSVVLQNFSDVSVATAPVASDKWSTSCFAY